MTQLIEKLKAKDIVPGVPTWLIPIALISVLSYLLQSIQYRRSNLSVFLFDYEYGFIRRGLLGSIVNLSPIEIEEYYVFWAFYVIVSVALFLSVMCLFHNSLTWKEGDRIGSILLFFFVILMSPIFLKNSFHDFGRVDQLGYLCLALFALAKPSVQRVLIVVLPPLLILCHEGQIILTVPPMMAIFLIGSLRERALFHLRTLVPLILSVVVSLALTVYFLQNGVPGVEHEVLSEYLVSKSPYNTGERSWLLYDGLQQNFSIAMGKGREFRQLGASPLYLLALILHLPVIALLYRFHKDTTDLSLRLACGLIALTVLVQGTIFLLSIDYARHIANLFLAFVIMLFFLIERFQLGQAVAAHADRWRTILIALAFIFAPIPKFGIVTP